LEHILDTAVIATFLGIFAQVVAHRYQLPAILPLLVFGMAAGPFGLGLFDPAALGDVLEVVIHLGVAIILFEGGLSLELRQLRQVSTTVRNLLTVGTLVTGAGAAWLAHSLTGVTWGVAALFGAIVTVTGPTVIGPLLRHMITPQRVRTILISEGLMIDPIGAVLAYFVLQWIDRAGLQLGILSGELLELFATGAVLGFVAGSVGIFVVRHRHMAQELVNLVILALLFASFMISEHRAPQSGIVASVVMGLTMSGADVPDLNPLKVFKGQLTTLTISVLFVLLSGQLDLGAMIRIGPSGLLVVAGLILVVRPLAVLLSVPPGQLGWREKLVLALTAPRGIVAAAVASLSAIQLRMVGAGEEGTILEGLVYLVILVTCLWATAMAPLLPRALGYLDDPSRRRAVLVGANLFAVELARLLRREGWEPVVIDAVPKKLRGLRDEKILTVVGDARDAATYEAAGVERDSYVLALTGNDELNLLIAELLREEFHVEHPVVAMQQQSAEFGSKRRAWIDVLAGENVDVVRWSRRVEDGKAEMRTLTLDHGPEALMSLRNLVREHPDNYFILCGWEEARPVFRFSLDNLERFDRITLFALGGFEGSPLEELGQDLVESEESEESEEGSEAETGETEDGEES